MIDRPVRYGMGHSPHDEGWEVFDDPHDPFGIWRDLGETLDQWRQSAAPDSTPGDPG